MRRHYFRKHRALRRLKKMVGKEKNQSALVVLEGPHESGKSVLIQKFIKKHKRASIFSCRDVAHMTSGKKENTSFLGDCVVVDDCEYLRGRDETQKKVADIIQKWQNDGKFIILSGVGLQSHLPHLFELLGKVS